MKTRFPKTIVVLNTGVIVDTETFQTMQDALKLFKLIAQSEAEIAKGKVIRQKDLFDALERELDAL